MTKRAFLHKYLTGNYLKMILMLTLAVTAVFLSLLSPLVFSYFIDYIIDMKPIQSPVLAGVIQMLGGVEYLRGHLWIGGILVITIYGLSALSMFLRSYLSGRIAEDMTYRIRNDLYRHLQRLPYSYHVTSKTGELIQKCTSDVDQIRRVFGGQLQQMVRSLCMVTIACYILFHLNAQLAWKAVILMPALFLYAFFFYKRNQKAFLEMDESEARFTAAVQENLAGIRVVKAFGREKYEIERFDHFNDEYRELNFSLLKLLGKYWSSSDIISMMQTLIVLFAGIAEARRGNLTIGNFFVFVNYESMILWPLRQLGRILADFGKSSVSIGRLIEIFDAKEEDMTTGVSPEIKGDIVFDHVGFQYDDGTVPVLKDISMHIKPGETVAIIGPTGSGKSSLVHLLSGLYDYTSGSIKIDGTELRDIRKGHLRRNVGIVLQEPFLFSRTIYDNIHLNHENASMKDVEKAAAVASVHYVIKEFDQGYDTLIGEKGVTLSGGQKQRIAIARTVLNDNKVLIFDDSLSAVDTETDAEIRKGIQSLNAGITTIIITQRVNSAQDADKIFVLEDGQITQEGTHRELIHQEGLYKRIYEIQSSYVKGGDE